MGALMGMGIGCFGIQVITTTCYTYSIDCYRVESSEVGQPQATYPASFLSSRLTLPRSPHCSISSAKRSA
jgi:hypothetical protein